MYERKSTCSGTPCKVICSEYKWHYMASAVHKLLIHGWRIVEATPGNSTGRDSEEPLETDNKTVKHLRKNHVRRDSAEHANEDLFRGLAASSDPVVCNINATSKLRERKLW